MANIKNTPQNVNKLPDKNKSGKGDSKNQQRKASEKLLENEKTGKGNTQSVTGTKKKTIKGKVTSRKVRDLG